MTAANLTSLDVQLVRCRALHDVPALDAEVWGQPATTICIGEAQLRAHEQVMPFVRRSRCPPRICTTSSSRMREWNRFALERKDSPHIVRAHVITQLYVSLILVRETRPLATLPST